MERPQLGEYVVEVGFHGLQEARAPREVAADLRVAPLGAVVEVGQHRVAVLEPPHSAATPPISGKGEERKVSCRMEMESIGEEESSDRLRPAADRRPFRIEPI